MGASRRPPRILAGVVAATGTARCGMPLSAYHTLALRSAIGTCLACSLALVPPLRASFSEEVRPLLPSAAAFGFFCYSTSLEATVKNACQGLLGTALSILNIGISVWLLGTEEAEITSKPHIAVYSWLSLVVVLQATMFAAMACLLPVDEGAKMYMLSMTGYFLLTLFSPPSAVTLGRLCMEYAVISLVGAGCAILAYSDVWPLPSAHDLRGAAKTFEAAALGCAELIRGAAAAILGGGAGQASWAIAHRRLEDLEAQLADARNAVEYHYWNPMVAMRRVTRRGQISEKVLTLQREVAFDAVGEAIDTCRLLLELAAQVHARATSIEAAVVKGAAAKRLRRVADGAADLLTEFVGIIMQKQGEQAWLTKGRSPIRKKLESMLRSSRTVAKELLMLSLYSGAEVEIDMSKGALASARSDMAAFLFLIHSLAANLLKSEARLRSAAIDARKSVLSEDEMDEMDEVASADEDLADRTSAMRLLTSPLLRKKSRMRANTAQSWWTPRVSCEALRRCGRGFFVALRSLGRSRAWHTSLKVTCTFTTAFGASLYLFGTDSTVVSTVAMLSNYGSQYSGSSLHRAVLRGVGIAAGATAGSAVRQFAIFLGMVIEDEIWGAAACSVASLVAIAGWVFFCHALYFDSGPYCYLGMVASFTAVKLIASWEDTPSTPTSTIVMYNMYASFIAAAVELGLRPVDALDVLRSRMVASLTGSAAVFSALVTAEEKETTLSVQVAREYLQGTTTLQPAKREASDSVLDSLKTASMPSKSVMKPMRPSSSILNMVEGDSESPNRASSAPETANGQPNAVGELPDLSDRLREAGIYGKYLQWREGYMRWRTGSGKGAHGELDAQTAAVYQESASADAAGRQLDEGGGDQAGFVADAAATASTSEAVAELEPHCSLAPLSQFMPAESFATRVEPLTGMLLSGGTPTSNIIGQEMSRRSLPPISAASGGAGTQHRSVSFGRQNSPSKKKAGDNELLPPLPEQPLGVGNAEGRVYGAILEFGEAPAEILLARGALAPAAEEDGFASQVSAQGSIQMDAAAPEGLAAMLATARLDVEAAAEHPLLDELVVSKFGTDLMSVVEVTAEEQASKAEFGDVEAPLDGIQEKEEEPCIVDVPRGVLEDSDKVSLRDIKKLLDELGSVLAPASNLASQASIRLSSSRVDAHHWRSLIYSLTLIRSQLSLISRIALRVGHSVFVADLLGSTLEGGPSAGDLAKDLVKVFMQVLGVSAVTISGRATVSPSMAAELELQLRSSASALLGALARRAEALGKCHNSNSSTATAAGEDTPVEAEVLAGAAGHAFLALLHEAAEVLAVAVALATQEDSEEQQATQVVNVDSDEEEDFSVNLDLPDLTSRLKEIGAYDKYLAWRDGYLRWRQGRADGAKKEVTEKLTT